MGENTQADVSATVNSANLFVVIPPPLLDDGALDAVLSKLEALAAYEIPYVDGGDPKQVERATLSSDELSTLLCGRTELERRGYRVAWREPLTPELIRSDRSASWILPSGYSPTGPRNTYKERTDEDEARGVPLNLLKTEPGHITTLFQNSQFVYSIQIRRFDASGEGEALEAVATVTKQAKSQS